MIDDLKWDYGNYEMIGIEQVKPSVVTESENKPKCALEIMQTTLIGLDRRFRKFHGSTYPYYSLNGGDYENYVEGQSSDEEDIPEYTPIAKDPIVEQMKATAAAKLANGGQRSNDKDTKVYQLYPVDKEEEKRYLKEFEQIIKKNKLL